MVEAARLALISVVRRWRRNLVSIAVVAAGVATLVILASVSIGSSEAVSSRLDEATRSQLTVLLPGASWSEDESTLLRQLRTDVEVTGAGTLVAPNRTPGSASVSTWRSGRTVEASVGVATPSGLRVAAVVAKSGALGTDRVVADLENAVYLGARIAVELDYPGVEAGHVVVNGRRLAVLGIIVSDEEAWVTASIVFPPASARAAGYLPDNRVLTVATDREVTPEVQSWLALTLSPLAPDSATVLSEPSAQELRAEVLERGNSLTGLVGIIAALTGFITLAATTFASLTERRREMGLYLALGYGRRFVSGQVVVEGTTVGLMGGLTGFLVGTTAAAAVSAVSFPLFYLPPVLVWLPLAAGVLGLASSLIPSLAAPRGAPSELLRH
jgi:putative ABC transport system permease protein